MSHFVFNGSSRMRNMTLARDHHKTRSSIIEDAQRLRLRREEEARRTRAAQQLQRAVRRWMACQHAVRAALLNVDNLASDVAALLSKTPGEDSASTALQAAPLTARLHSACWSLSYVRRHASLIPLHRPPYGTTVDAEEGASPAVKSWADLRAYQDRVLWTFSQRFFTAFTDMTTATTAAALTGGAEEDATSAPAVSRAWRVLFASLPTADVTLLLCVLLQRLSRAAGSDEGASRSAVAVAAELRLVQVVVAALVEHNEAYGRTSATSVGEPGTSCAAADLDRWPAVHALTAALTILTQEALEKHVALRSPCASLLQPLADAFPVFSTVEQVKGAGPLSLPPSAFADACWTCLCTPHGAAAEEYLSLTADPLAVLLGAAHDGAATAATTDAAGPSAARRVDDGHGAVSTFVAVLVAECHRRIVADSAVAAGSGVAGLRGGETRARVLGRLVRLLPRMQRVAEAASCDPVDGAATAASAAARTEVLKGYLLSVSCLCERLCREDFFIEGILADHYAYNTGRYHHRDGCSPYRLLASNLFSTEGGLRLLGQLTAADERAERLRLEALQQPTMEAPTDANAAASLGPGEESGGAPPREDEEAVGAGGSSGGGTAPASSSAAAPSASAARWPSSASLQQSPLEVLCNVFAWPIFTFSKPRYSRYQQETLALYAKLVRTPQLLRRLWSLYWQSCEGLRAVLPPGEALQKLCAPSVVGAPESMQPYRAGQRRVPAAAASAPVLLSLPRLPTWETHPCHPLAFFDPHASLSTFFFTLLGYCVNVCDFADELHRGGDAAVLSTEEACALVLALKEVVHRAHMYGVVPDTNGEAVAHAACVLLGRLHVVNEADPFVPVGATGLWMSVGAIAAETAVSVLVRVWDAASNAVVEEEAADWEDPDSELDGLDRVVAEEGGGGRPAAVRGARGRLEGAAAAASSSLQALVRLPGDDVAFHGSSQWKQQTRYTKLLVHSPFLFPFAARALLLSALLVETDLHWSPPSERRAVVQRGRAFVDAFDLFHDDPLSADMHNIRFVGEDGTLEAGYGRGVYRECIVSLCKEGFAAEYGLFRQTPDGYVYPNSFSGVATSDPQHLQKIRFLGAMVGRALRDGVLQDVPFALHFRNAILGRRNTLSHLKRFDAELYHQLMSLTRLDAEELQAVELTFVYTVNALGITREVELVPGGAKMEVTPRNCLYYVHLVADFKLNREAAEQTRAFCGGLRSVIDANRLRLFDSNEVGKLFGGDETGQIDLEDWKANTVYDKPEDAQAPPVRLFWDVVESLTREQQRKLLKFVTSMTRPPLLGFRFLSPPFKVQLLASNASGPDHLPSAATCFSTMKLPPYRDYATARAKIIAAIEETSTFEFS